MAKVHTPNARLTPQQVVAMRLDYADWVAAGGRPATFVYQTADRYRIGVETVRRMLRGETFRHLALTPQAPEDAQGEDAMAAASFKRLIADTQIARKLTADGMLEELQAAPKAAEPGSPPTQPVENPFF